MKIYKKIFFIFFLTFFLNFSLKADTTYPSFVDFKFILNESDAGKKAQAFIKKELNAGLKKIKEKQTKLQDEEKKIIQQKKILSPEEYKKKVTDLRNQVSSLQKERNKILKTVADYRNKAQEELLKNLNPIIEEYMKEKKIRMVIDKKNILMADKSLEITKEIMVLLNKKLKSIDLK